MQSVRNPVYQATGEVDTIFGGGNGWGNKSAPLSDPRTLGIPGGATVIITQQATTLPVGVNTPMERTTAHNLHRALMGGNPTLHNTVVGGNGMGGATGTVAAPASSPVAGQPQCAGKGEYGMVSADGGREKFGPAATTQEFS